MIWTSHNNMNWNEITFLRFFKRAWIVMTYLKSIFHRAKWEESELWPRVGVFTVPLRSLSVEWSQIQLRSNMILINVSFTFWDKMKIFLVRFFFKCLHFKVNSSDIPDMNKIEITSSSICPDILQLTISSYVKSTAVSLSHLREVVLLIHSLISWFSQIVMRWNWSWKAAIIS